MPLNIFGTGEFTSQRPVTRSFEVFFDLRSESKQSRHRWFETQSRSLRRHCNDLFLHWYHSNANSDEENTHMLIQDSPKLISGGLSWFQVSISLCCGYAGKWIYMIDECHRRLFLSGPPVTTACVIPTNRVIPILNFWRKWQIIAGRGWVKIDFIDIIRHAYLSQSLGTAFDSCPVLDTETSFRI